MYKKMLLIMVLVLALGSVAYAQDEEEGERWLGADELPVAPLVCPGEETMEEMSDEEMAEEGEEESGYDGAFPSNLGELAGEDIVVVDIPKLIGIGYFNATSQGAAEAAEELGNVEYIFDGPTNADVIEQIEFVERYITQGVDGILIAANDPLAISPVLRDALDEGVTVVGYDANSETDSRSWFINQATPNGFAKTLMDSMMAEIGEEGRFAIITTTFTAPNQARWIAEMQAYTEKCYPDAVWLETVEAQEDQQVAFQRTQALINSYGSDLDGIIGLSSVVFPGAADAVQQAGLCPVDATEGAADDEDVAVHVTGGSTPNQMRPFVENGCVKSVVLWNPIDLGYAAMYALRATVDGELTADSTELEAGRLGTLQIINGSEILLGEPFVFTAENINDFDF